MGKLRNENIVILLLNIFSSSPSLHLLLIEKTEHQRNLNTEFQLTEETFIDSTCDSFRNKLNDTILSPTTTFLIKLL